MGQSDAHMAYLDSQLDALNLACPGMKKGECAQVRILSGAMPAFANCTGNPATDAANTACLTAPQQTSIANWIGAGMPE